uniref:Exostosin GT47 domain-containing protein n=1 Tax=Ananas comosus var. bracteatus TaxID=296719 RepID=A0A6V7P2C4_ANACO|nr:unnamed protein product [Ananas comosus var. bracteatus]
MRVGRGRGERGRTRGKRTRRSREGPGEGSRGDNEGRFPAEEKRVVGVSRPSRRTRAPTKRLPKPRRLFTELRRDGESVQSFRNIYTTEGRFIETLESMTQQSATGVRTWDPRRAHAFFLPFSVTEMVQFIYRPLSYDHRPLQRFVADYVDVVASKHPFWNRTGGADHFMLSCHDWVRPHASRGHPELYTNSIRALCNANTTEGFQPAKDVSIPEINLLTGDIPHQLLSPPPDLPARRFLAFFAGGLHGPSALSSSNTGRAATRPLPVYEYLPKGLDYYHFMLHSRFCLCPSGGEPEDCRGDLCGVRAGGDLRGVRTAVRGRAAVGGILGVGGCGRHPAAEEVLEQIPAAEVERLREGVRAVKRHFVFNHPPKRFDVFNMILHSVWLRRLNLKLGH